MIPFNEALTVVFAATYDWKTMTSASKEEIDEVIKFTGWTPEEFRLKLGEVVQNYIDDVDRTLSEHS